MYIPKHFAVTDNIEILTFIAENAFGQLVSSVDGRPFVTHLPFFISEDKAKLIGHLAIQNPQQHQLEGQEVLVTFLGPHDYISPTWYASPGVPTWNYQAVHVYGRAEVMHNPDQIRAVVDRLAQKYEASNPTPWLPEYNDTMLRAIVAFEVAISEIQCKYKLSQNRPAQDRKQVIEQLQNRGAAELAKAMEQNCSQ